MDNLQGMENTFSEYLLKSERVNDLTAEFVRSFKDQLNNTVSISDCQEIRLWNWLRTAIFKVSVIAFYGERLLEVYTELTEDFSVFDASMLALLFGLPRWLTPKEYRIRDQILDGFERW